MGWQPPLQTAVAVTNTHTRPVSGLATSPYSIGWWDHYSNGQKIMKRWVLVSPLSPPRPRPSPSPSPPPVLRYLCVPSALMSLWSLCSSLCLLRPERFQLIWICFYFLREGNVTSVGECWLLFRLFDDSNAEERWCSVFCPWCVLSVAWNRCLAVFVVLALLYRTTWCIMGILGDKVRRLNVQLTIIIYFLLIL